MKKSTAVKVDENRMSNTNRPVEVTKAYNELKDQSMDELRKKERLELEVKSDKKNSTSQKLQTNTKYENPQNHQTNSSITINKQSSLKRLTNMILNSEEEIRSGKESTTKKSSMSRPVTSLRISRLSKNGRATNYSVFYQNYMEKNIVELDKKGSNVKQSDYSPISNTLTFKKSDRHISPRVTKIESNSSAKKEFISGKKNEQVGTEKKVSKLSEKIKNVLEAENTKDSKDDLDKLETEIKKEYDPIMIDEFYKYCKEVLPEDHRYKESILFVSLFYYFLETKNLLDD